MPLVHFSNGTDGSCAQYAGTLEHLASHGFLTACYESGETGSGNECKAALGEAMDRYGARVADRVGSTGVGQGGAGAILCVYEAEQAWGEDLRYAVHAAAPAHSLGGPLNYSPLYSQIRSPVFMFNGTRDLVVSALWVGTGFGALSPTTEAYWFTALSANREQLGSTFSRDSAVAWFRWKLLDDPVACNHFKSLPDSGEWSWTDSQAERPCK